MAILSLSGMAFGAEIVMNGSTTVLPIAQAAAEKYMAANEGVKISVSGGGSGNGIKAIIDGTTDIANSSRFIKQDEVKAAVKHVPRSLRGGGHGCPAPHRPPTTPSRIFPSISSGRFTPARSPAGRTWAEGTAIAVVGRDTSSGTYEDMAGDHPEEGVSPGP